MKDCSRPGEAKRESCYLEDSTALFVRWSDLRALEPHPIQTLVVRQKGNVGMQIVPVQAQQPWYVQQNICQNTVSIKIVVIVPHASQPSRIHPIQTLAARRMLRGVGEGVYCVSA